jgi:hypothetical protein
MLRSDRRRPGKHETLLAIRRRLLEVTLDVPIEVGHPTGKMRLRDGLG